MHLRAEDSGEYTLRAINRWGEIISTSTLNVIGQWLSIFCGFYIGINLFSIPIITVCVFSHPISFQQHNG